MEAATTAFNKWYYYLNRTIVKQEKPCLPDDFVHIHKWGGCFRVYDVNVHCFRVLRQRKYVDLPWSEFRCKKGEGILGDLLDLRNEIVVNYHQLGTSISKFDELLTKIR